MKIPLLIVGLCVYACSVAAQSKFAGEYIGIGSPQRWIESERAVVDIFVTPGGNVEIHVSSYDLEWPGMVGTGLISPKGKFIITMENGYLVTGSISAAGGTIKGMAKMPDGSSGAYTYTCYRRMRYAYNPAN